ncbi:MAG: glycosyltransferase family 39 protein [bacterium]
MKPELKGKRINLLVLAVIAAGFILRLLTANNTWLNPDEALNYLIANQSSLTAVYQASLTNPHPPLYFLLLFLWRLLGTSEIMLRLLTIVASSAAGWFFYRWLVRAVNPAAGLAGLIIFTFLPALVGNGTEVRSYSLMLLLVSVSLYLMETGIRENSSWNIVLAGIFSALAGSAHYSALWFSVSLGIYFLVSGLSRRLTFRVLLAGIAGQTMVALVYLWLYLTHLKNISHSPMTVFAITGWLRDSYLQPGENPLFFIGRNTVGLFSYLAGSKLFGYMLLGLFTAGMVVLTLRRQVWLVLLILAPFVFSIAGALLRLMPYGGTRHNILLGLFAGSGIAGLTLAIKPKYQFAGAGVAGLIALLTNLLLSTPGQHIPRPDSSRYQMQKAIAFLRSSAPAGDTIFTDYQGSTLLSYYLARSDRPVQFFGRTGDGFQEFDYGGYLVVSTQEWDFNHQRLRFPALIDRLSQHYHWGPERVIWVFDGGWGRPLVVRQEEFGRNLSVFAVTPGMFITSAVAESLLLGAIARLQELNLLRARMVVLPSRFASAKVRTVIAGLGVRPLTYQELYQHTRQNKQWFDAQLPALLCWLFNAYEWHPDFMSYMADGESYIAGGYRFTLLLMDVNRQIAVYRLEPD